MQRVDCPHCGKGAGLLPELAGQTVACPHCAGRFTMPLPFTSQPLVSVDDEPMSGVVITDRRSPHTIVVHSSSASHPRLKPHGWFANSLGVSIAFFFAFFLFVLAVGWAGYLYMESAQKKATVASKTSAAKAKQAERQQIERLKAAALPHLEKRGLLKIGDEIESGEEGGEVYISGVAMDKDNRIHEFLARFYKATIDGQEVWQLMDLFLDGEYVFRQKRPKWRDE